MHAIDRARDLLEFYRDKTRSLVDEHTLFATLTHGRYVNYLGDDEMGDLVAAAYGANYRRLQRIKAK